MEPRASRLKLLHGHGGAKGNVHNLVVQLWQHENRRNAVVVEQLSGLQRAAECCIENLMRTMKECKTGIVVAAANGWQHGMARRQALPLASLSNVMSVSGFFSSRKNNDGKKGTQERRKGSSERVPYLPKRGTYAYDVLLRQFKELDNEDLGFISISDLKSALKKLHLPASESDLQDFVGTIDNPAETGNITFEQFSKYAIERENELLDTFKELDKRNVGYITANDLKTALKNYDFRVGEGEMGKLVTKLHGKGRPKGAAQFFNQGNVFDLAEYRDFLMLSTAKDLGDGLETWGSSVVDLGDIDTPFIFSSSGDKRKHTTFGQPSRQEIANHLLAGGLSAALSRSVVAPLERVKIMSMVNKDVAKAGLAPTLNYVLREEGIAGLFKGQSLNIMRIFPSKAVEFLVYDSLWKTKRADTGGLEQILFGSIASVAGAFVSHPLETIRSVIAGQANGKLGVSGAARTITDGKGLVNLYQGLGPHLIRVVPYGAINFGVYNQLRQWYRNRLGPDREMKVVPAIIFGALAGLSAHAATYPLETVQRRLQVEASKQGPASSKAFVHYIQLIIREEGLGALFAGITPSLAKVVPAAVVSFLAYEKIKEQLSFD